MLYIPEKIPPGISLNGAASIELETRINLFHNSIFKMLTMFWCLSDCTTEKQVKIHFHSNKSNYGYVEDL